MTTNFSQTAAYIWSLAELLRGDFKQSQYGRVILPFTILRRLECVLAPRKEVVLKEVEKLIAQTFKFDTGTPQKLDPALPTAIILVDEHRGVGIHTIM